MRCSLVIILRALRGVVGLTRMRSEGRSLPDHQPSLAVPAVPDDGAAEIRKNYLNGQTYDHFSPNKFTRVVYHQSSFK